MKLKLIRQVFTPKTTLGELFIDGVHFCWTLEDMDRDKNKDGDLSDTGEAKVYGETAIPSGTYKVILTFSNHFKRLLPLLVNVVGYEGVRIHRGNTAKDTLGCVLVGFSKGIDQISQSAVAEEALMVKLATAKDIELEIVYAS